MKVVHLFHVVISIVLSVVLLEMSGARLSAQGLPSVGGAVVRLDQKDRQQIEDEIRRVRPYYAIRHLARFQEMQNRVGGGFCGCMADLSIHADTIPLPVDDAGVRETAAFLTELKRANLDALEDLGVPTSFVPDPFVGMPAAKAPLEISVTIDLSVPSAFLAAIEDGEASLDEAREIARMPVNRELLRFVCARCHGTELRTSEQTLTYLIWKAGSSDPLDRIWRWLNPMNDFGYADLAVDREAYARRIAEIDDHREAIVSLVAARAAAFFPKGASVQYVFAFAPGCFTGDWATSDMSGANLPEVRGGWQNIVRCATEGVIREYLTRTAETWDRDDSIGRTGALDGDRSDVLRELVTATVIEGTIDYVADPFSTDSRPAIEEGATLFGQCIKGIADGAPVEHVRSLVEGGKGDGGPLQLFGRHLARAVAEADGARAVTEMIDADCGSFIRRAVEIDIAFDDRIVPSELDVVLQDLLARPDQ
jgi:hypothetical protein